MDASKPGKGILASLEHARGKSPVRIAPQPGRGPALVIGSGLLVGVVLAWWIHSGPSPVIVHEASLPVPQPALAVPMAAASSPVPEEVEAQAAAIIDEPAPSAPSTAVAAALAPAPIATVVMRRDRPVAAKPQPKPVRKEAPVRPVRPAATPDSDVALLTALVAHASGNDVVEPHLADSTTSLLQRCSRVGGEEGRLCRLRICATRPDDDACRPQ